MNYCLKSSQIFLLFLSSIPYLYSQQLSPSVRISLGAVNGVFIQRNGKTLVVYGDSNRELKKAEMVLFTHFRRDVIWAGRDLIKKGSLAIAPFEQKAYFIKADSIWKKSIVTRFHDYANQTTKIGISPLDIHRFVQPGETVQWQDLKIKVLNTTGYTRGSVSYIADIDNKRFAFTGDLIYGDGKILDLYSFQDALPGVDGYHGYAARLGQLVKSLQHIAGQKPDFLVPSRGPVISDPEAAIKKLLQRVHSLYKNYLSITAQRWNHTDRMITLSNHVLDSSNIIDWMPFATVIEKRPPSWYQHIGPSNLLMAEDSTGFLVDGGSKMAFQELLKFKRSGMLKKLDGLFITHYHDDHTELVNNIVKEFDCPVYVTKELKDILENPGAYDMPCLTNKSIQNLTIMNEGQKMSWKDFELTFFYFPGQTLYHDALLFEKGNGEAIFFLGDSFSPAGVDDYCFQNRNMLHPGTGYFYCLEVLKKLPPSVLLSNQHIQPLFKFSRHQLDHMGKVLQERNAILKDLLPWDNVNYGTDNQWLSIYPYAQKAAPGQTIACTVKIFNHSNITKTFTVKPSFPKGFMIVQEIPPLIVEPQKEGKHTFKVKISKKAPSGLSLLLVNVKFDEWDLREWSEACIEL